MRKRKRGKEKIGRGEAKKERRGRREGEEKERRNG